MTDLSHFRPFTVEGAFHAAYGPHLQPGAIGSPVDLITACQVRHIGYPELRRADKGVTALATWLFDHQAELSKPRLGSHPFQSGTLIERILAGEVMPSEEFAHALAAATAGAVLPEMFGQREGADVAHADPEIEPDPSAVNAPVADGASEPQEVSPCSPAAPAHLPEDIAFSLPCPGVLGGQLPPGRLFHPIADARTPGAFVLSGCGLGLHLDEGTAIAMRDALNTGIGHLRAQRATGLGRAA